MVVDYRGLNKVTLRRYFIIPNADALKSTVAGSKYISVGDLKEGFNQVDNEPETAQKMAVLAASGSYLPRGLTFGPTNGPEDFQELVFMIFGKKLYTEWFLFLDDLTVATGRPKSLPPGPSGAADVTESNLTFSVAASMECEARVTPLGTRLRCTIAEVPEVAPPSPGATPGKEPKSVGAALGAPASPVGFLSRRLVIPQVGREETSTASSAGSGDQRVRRTIPLVGRIPWAAETCESFLCLREAVADRGSSRCPSQLEDGVREGCRVPRRTRGRPPRPKKADGLCRAWPRAYRSRRRSRGAAV